MLPPILVELKANAGEFMAKMGEARHEVAKLEHESAGHVAKFAAVGQAALLGLGGVAVGVGGMAVKAALEGEKAHAALAQAVKNTGGSMEAFEPRVEAVTAKFAKLGYTRDQLEQGLAAMTTALGSPTKALQNMGLAADLAAVKHVDLETASVAVAKALEGNLRPLKQLGIDLPVAAGGAKALAQAHQQLQGATQKLNTFLKIHRDAVNANSKSHGTYLQMVDKVHQAQAKLNAVQGAATSITDGLTKRIGGQAAAAANTYAGKLEAAKAQAENLMETLGNHLLPVIARLIGATTRLVEWFGRHTTTAKILAGVIGGLLVGAITVYLGTLAVATVRTIAHTVAVTAGTVRMGARIAMVYASKAAEIAANVATKAWTVGQWLLNAALDANPIGIVVIAIAALVAGVILAYQHSETFRRIVHALWDMIKRSPLGELISHLGLVRDAVGWVVDKVEALIHALGNIHMPSIHMPHIPGIPGFAKGVQNFAGGLAMVGERGPELVELPGGSNVYPHGTGPAGGGVIVNVNVAGHVTTEHDLAMTIRNVLLSAGRNGAQLGLA